MIMVMVFLLKKLEILLSICDSYNNGMDLINIGGLYVKIYIDA